MLEHTLSQEEHGQIVSTIEMFEVITQTQPDDYQSLEILKDAYAKIGRTDDAFRTSRRLAEAYFNAGSYTLAMQECELVLQREPNSPEVLAMLGDIESRVSASGQSLSVGGPKNGLIAAPQLSGLSERTAVGGLIEPAGRTGGQSDADHGDEQLAKFLIVQQLFPQDEVTAARETVRQLNTTRGAETLAASLIDKLCRQNDDKVDAVMSALIDRTKFAFLPLEYYDVDRQVAKMLPEELTLGRLFVPFDLISRTIMVACCNPFDAAGRDAVQRSLDYTVSWYLARPAAIIKSLQEVYRLESRA